MINSIIQKKKKKNGGKRLTIIGNGEVILLVKTMKLEMKIHV